MKTDKTAIAFPAAPDKVNCPKKTPARGGRQVIEAGFIQARNLSSSETLIVNYPPNAKH